MILEGFDLRKKQWIDQSKKLYDQSKKLYNEIRHEAPENFRKRPRSLASILRQGEVRLNANCAAATAASTSSFEKCLEELYTTLNKKLKPKLRNQTEANYTRNGLDKKTCY
uniref:Uncharacterized protein n=1 Tax=Romanomermis culicivorax TaxID=13658 RepID=A0A915JEV8_ROMCU